MIWVLAKGDTVANRAYIPVIFKTKEQAMKAAERYPGFHPEAGTPQDVANELALYASHHMKQMKMNRRRRPS